MNFDDYNFDDEDRNSPPSAWKKWRIPIITVLGLGGIVAGVLAFAPKKASTPPRKPMEAIVSIAPPPPPPPVVQPPPPPPEPQVTQEIKQDEIVDTLEPDDPSTPDEATTAGPAGNDAFKLAKGNGRGSGNKPANPFRKTGQFDKYALGLQSSIQEAMRRNPTTARSTMSVVVRIWADQAGRITRATLVEPSGNAQVDEALRGSALVGLQIQAPPQGMPMPITMKIAGRRPQG